MKAYIIGENKVFPYLYDNLKDFLEIYNDKNQYSIKGNKVLKSSDLLLKTSFTDVIILLDCNIFEKKLMLDDCEINFDERIIENFKNCLWMGITYNEKIDYYIDKYNLNYINLSQSMPLFLTSKIALSEILLSKIIQTSSKLAHQRKILVAGYSASNKIICDLLSVNKNIVIVSDRMLHLLVEAKNDGYGILLKEELAKQPINFDIIILDDEYILKKIDFLPHQQVFFIDYEERKKEDKKYQVIYPYFEISQKYPKVIADSLKSCIKKEIKEYFRGE